jgi:hypothetical protein
MSDVSLEIFDVQGRLIKTLANGRQAAGEYTFTWSTEIPGIYISVLRTNDKVIKRKILKIE